MEETIKRSNLPIVVAFSGGKDSVAMVLYLLQLGIAKERIHLHHHDVDGMGAHVFDWDCTRDYCKAFARVLKLKLFFSYREGGIMREVTRDNQPRGDVYFQMAPGRKFHCAPANKKSLNTRKMWPAVSANLATRWCSSTVKIDVLRTVLAHNPLYEKGCYVLTGERWEESTARAKYLPVEIYPVSNKNRPMIWWKPILSWTEGEVWQLIAKHCIVPHPAYYLGWSRCSCMTCIFNSPNVWATINEIAPQRVGKISLTEQLINHTLYNNKTIVEKVNEDKAMEYDGFWLDQSRKFTTPIIATQSTWKLPKGAFSKEKSGSV